MARELSSIPGTVSEVFTKHLNELHLDAPLPELKAEIINLLRSDEIRRTSGAEKFVSHIQSLNNRSAILSTITTYVTCNRCKLNKRGA